MALRRFDNDPRYQRAIAKLHELTPDQLAIVNTLKIDQAFATEDIRNELALMDLAAFRERTRGELSLRTRSLGARQRAFKTSRRQQPLANAIGLLNVGASTLFGLGQMRISRIRERKLDALIEANRNRIRL